MIALLAAHPVLATIGVLLTGIVTAYSMQKWRATSARPLHAILRDTKLTNAERAVEIGIFMSIFILTYILMRLLDNFLRQELHWKGNGATTLLDDPETTARRLANEHNLSKQQTELLVAFLCDSNAFVY